MAENTERLIDNARWVVTEVVNRALAMDPTAQHHLAGLAGQRLRLELEEPSVRLDVVFEAERVDLQPADDALTPDASVATPLAGLVRLAASRGERSRDVAFRGDIGTIQAVRRLVAELEIDWEEQLSRVTGDVAAHRIGTGVQRGREWARYAGGRVLADVGEYVTEEQRLLPTEPEVTPFHSAVRRLRSDVDRLEARLKRIERQRGD